MSNLVRFPGPPMTSVLPDVMATRAQRATEAREDREAKACLWCGSPLPTKRATCSHACRSALSRYERAMRAGEPVPLYKGQRARPMGVR